VSPFWSRINLSSRVVSLDPPLPVYLFNLVSSLRDKTAKGYPIKKVLPTQISIYGANEGFKQLLLVLWKTLLTCWGGVRDHERVKKLARDIAGLPPVTEASSEIQPSLNFPSL